MSDVIDILNEALEVDVSTATVLTELYERDGKLTPEQVLGEAVDPDSPLHDRFEWDDAVASHKYRVAQARHLIASVMISIEEKPIRAFPYIPSTGSYMPVKEAMGSTDWRGELVEKFRRDAECFRDRWSRHKFLADEYEKWVKAEAAKARRKK